MLQASIRRALHSLAVAAFVVAASPRSWATDSLAPLRAQFALPEHQIDYTEAKLVVDTLWDPSTNASKVRRQLDRWESAVRANFPKNATARQKFDALIKTLYEPGPWNGHNPFDYNFDDPMGKGRPNKHLGTYLNLRKGNCVSMPILVLVLGQRLGLPVTLATAPMHLLVKFADDTQQAWINFEATAGGFKFDRSYERELGITQEALENGLYLRPLMPREVVGLMASTLMQRYAEQKDAESLMAVADLALAANPRDSTAMIFKGNAYYLMIEERYRRPYPNPSDIPSELIDDYRALSRENLVWFSRAESLGWSQPTSETYAEYIKSIEREKARRTK